MNRCVSAFLIAAALLAPGLSAAQETVTRPFPANALRGDLQLTDPPDVLLNGATARLSPGSRIRGTNNLLAMSGALVGATYKVNYTVDHLGQIRDVWLLRADEWSNFWPRSSAEADNYHFDPVAQTWYKK